MNSRNTGDHDWFQLWAQIVTELRRLGMWENGSPLGWAAKRLVCDRLRLDPTPENTPYHDAIRRQSGDRYQIKARTFNGKTPNINGLNGVDDGLFDFLVVVIFQEDHRTVRQAFRMRHATVSEVAKTTPTGRNGHGFNLTAALVKRKDVEDITEWLA